MGAKQRVIFNLPSEDDKRLDKLDEHLREALGVPSGGGWRSRIVSALISAADVEELVRRFSDERKAA